MDAIQSQPPPLPPKKSRANRRDAVVMGDNPPPLPARTPSLPPDRRRPEFGRSDSKGRSEVILRNPRPGLKQRPPSGATEAFMMSRKPMPLPIETQRSIKCQSLCDLSLVRPLESPSASSLPRPRFQPGPRPKKTGVVDRFFAGLRQITKHEPRDGEGPRDGDMTYADEDIHSNLALLGIQGKLYSTVQDGRENYAALGNVMLELQQTLDTNRSELKRQTRSTIRLTRRARDPLPPIPGKQANSKECSICHQRMFFLGLLKCPSNHVVCIECISEKGGNVPQCPTCEAILKPYLEPPSEAETRGPGGGSEHTSAVRAENEYGLPCGCCYVDLGEDMVQCTEGHLFCTDCLHDYLQEIVYGQGRPPPECMTDGCGQPFPFSQIERVLSEAELEQYGNRLQREAISMAGLLQKIVYCPKCQYAALPDDGVKVFSCPSCQHQSCCECHADWKDHKGLTCAQVEKKDEVDIRLSYEEQMTKITIRICHKCRSPFTKSDGCNLITCQCKATMCYICRKPNIKYGHFCQHLHEPGKGCKKCTACVLFTNAEEDEKRAIAELQKAAQVQRAKKGFTDKRAVGAPMSI